MLLVLHMAQGGVTSGGSGRILIGCGLRINWANCPVGYLRYLAYLISAGNEARRFPVDPFGSAILRTIEEDNALAHYNDEEA